MGSKCDAGRSASCQPSAVPVPRKTAHGDARNLKLGVQKYPTAEGIHHPCAAGKSPDIHQFPVSVGRIYKPVPARATTAKHRFDPRRSVVVLMVVTGLGRRRRVINRWGRARIGPAGLRVSPVPLRLAICAQNVPSCCPDCSPLGHPSSIPLQHPP